MLNQEYYVKKNMVGRDKLYFSLKRQYGANAPTQKAINDWLQQQKVHQIHKRQFQTKTITPIRNVKKPNQLWQMDLIDMGSKPDNGFKWIITAIDLFFQICVRSTDVEQRAADGRAGGNGHVPSG